MRHGVLLATFLMLGAAPHCLVAQLGDVAGRVDAYVQRWHEVGRLDGVVLVARGDQVLYERAFGLANREWGIPNAPDTRFDIGSISKQFTTVIVLQLVAEGRLRLQDRLIDHIPEFRRDTGERITVDHLLRHTSGLPCYVRDWRPTAEERRRGQPRLLREHLKQEWLVQDFMARDLLSEPGSRYHYSSSNHYLLGLIIERVTRRSFAENLSERILQPLALGGTGLLRPESSTPRLATGYVRIPVGSGRGPYYFHPNTYGAGGMYSTARDLHTWNRAMERGAVVPDTLRELLFTPYTSGDDGAEHAYATNRFSLRLRGSSAPVAYTGFSGAIDGFRTDVFRFPSTGHIVVILDNSEQYEHWRIAPGIFRVLSGETVEQPHQLASAVVSGEAMDRGIDAAVARCQSVRAHPAGWDELDALENDLDEFASRYDAIGRPEPALTLRLLSTRLFPTSATGWERLADARAVRGDEARAAEARERAAALVSREQHLLEMLDRGEYDSARERIRQIRSGRVEEPLFTASNVGPRFGRAMQAKDFVRARGIAEVWALGNPTDAGPQFSLANVFRTTGEIEKAISCYRRVLELVPEGPIADRARSEIAALRLPR